MRTTLLLAALACLASAGCGTVNVDPPAPRANTGYVDFYTDSSLGLSWEVKRAEEPAGEMRKVFSEFKPVDGNILRLAASPGKYRFQVWFINELTDGPRDVVIEVANGKITPVHVTLSPVGMTAVDSRTYEYRPTARATRRVTKSSTDQEEVFQIRLAPAAPAEYQPKEKTPYYK